jgi:hypothetical protein
MFFQCNRCLKYFDTKYHYDKHLGRKIQCKEIINKKLDEDVIDKLDKNTISIESVKNNLSEENILILDLSEKLDDNTNINTFINSKNNGYKCSICNIIYKHSQSLYTHKRQKHPFYI